MGFWSGPPFFDVSHYNLSWCCLWEERACCSWNDVSEFTRHESLCWWVLGIRIPVVAWLGRPKEPAKGPQSEISWEYFSQSWLQIALFHFLYCDKGMIWYWRIHIHVQNARIRGWQAAGRCLLRIRRECRDVQNFSSWPVWLWRLMYFLKAQVRYSHCNGPQAQGKSAI